MAQQLSKTAVLQKRSFEGLKQNRKSLTGSIPEIIAGPEVSSNEHFFKMKESANDDLAICLVRWKDSWCRN